MLRLVQNKQQNCMSGSEAGKKRRNKDAPFSMILVAGV